MSLGLDGALDCALSALRRGEPIVLMSGDGSPGGLIAAAGGVSPATVARLVRWGTGYLRVAVLNASADRLDLPLVTSTDRGGAAAHYTVSVDARDGIGTGISAADRARTIGLLADPGASAASFTRPGHVVPVRVHATALAPYRWPEAALDLPRLARRATAGVFCELVSIERPGALAETHELTAFAVRHGLAAVELAQVRAAATAVRSADHTDGADREENRDADPIRA